MPRAAHLPSVGPPARLRLAEQVKRASPAALPLTDVPHARKPVPNRQRLGSRHGALHVSACQRGVAQGRHSGRHSTHLFNDAHKSGHELQQPARPAGLQKRVHLLVAPVKAEVGYQRLELLRRRRHSALAKRMCAIDCKQPPAAHSGERAGGHDAPVGRETCRYGSPGRRGSARRAAGPAE